MRKTIVDVAKAILKGHNLEGLSKYRDDVVPYIAEGMSRWLLEDYEGASVEDHMDVANFVFDMLCHGKLLDVRYFRYNVKHLVKNRKVGYFLKQFSQTPSFSDKWYSHIAFTFMLLP